MTCDLAASPSTDSVGDQEEPATLEHKELIFVRDSSGIQTTICNGTNRQLHPWPTLSGEVEPAIVAFLCEMASSIPSIV